MPQSKADTSYMAHFAQQTAQQIILQIVQTQTVQIVHQMQQAIVLIQQIQLDRKGVYYG